MKQGHSFGGFFELPPTDLIPTKNVREALDEFIALNAQQREAENAAYELENARTVAVEADRAAYAEAIRKGEDDPGTPATTEHDRQTVDARRKAEAFAEAVAASKADLTAVIEDNRDALAEAFGTRRTKAASAYVAAIDAARQAHEDIAATAALEAWLDGFPDTSRWVPGRHFASVEELIARNGSPMAIGAVLDALRGLTEYAEPPRGQFGPLVHHGPEGNMHTVVFDDGKATVTYG